MTGKTDDQPFLTSVLELRERARSNIADGAVTPNYGGNVE